MAPKSYAAQERQWKAQSDLRTLAEAEQIRTDRSRLSAAKSEARKQVNSLSKVAKRK